MYDPIKLTDSIKKIVVNKNEKKYFRFRPTRFYGGISTADTVGCNLRCAFCWSANSVWNAKKTGEFYSPKKVADKLHTIASKKNYDKLRVSGGEPTIGRQHLIKLLENIERKYLFVLETNGILLGYDKRFVKQLSSFKNIHIRVCLKGCNRDEFSLLTDAEPRGFDYQLKSLNFLKNYGVSFNIAFVTTKNEKEKENFYQMLKEKDLGEIMLEEEQIKLYPKVKKRLKDRGLMKYFK